MIKIIGCILIVVGAGGTGLYLSYKPFYRKITLNSFNLALEILENEINNYSSLMEAFFKISNRLRDKDIRDMFLELYNRMKEKNGENIEQLWLEVLEKEKNKLFLNGEDLDYLREFAGILMAEDRELEIKNIAILKRHIELAIKDINKEYLKNKKMLQSVGFMGGLIIAIALI